MLVGRIPHVETSEMAVNSVKESLPIFFLMTVIPPPQLLSILQAIDWEAETSAVRCNGRKVDIHANACGCLAAVLIQKWSQK